MKFVEALILLYTPDPSGSLESPSHEGISLWIYPLNYVNLEVCCSISIVMETSCLYNLVTCPEGIQADFKISILRGGHPVLNIGDLSVEASQKLGLLLDQLRHPAAKSLNSSTIIVLINR